jgi:ubiquitin C-terminal hydrolase
MKAMRAPPACGLANLGNTCYLNAVLQAIAHVPSFVRMLLNAPRPVDPVDPVYTELRQAITAMWGHAGRPRTVVNVNSLVDALRPRMALMGAGDAREQCDAHEAYCILADVLCELRWEKQVGPMRPVLCGETQQLVRCDACGTTSARLEDFSTLSLPLTGTTESNTVSTMLAAHFAPERIVGFSCDVCSAHAARALHVAPTTSAARLCRLWRLPKMLVVCVKRFVDPASVSRTDVQPCEELGPALLLRISAVGSPAASLAPTSMYRLTGIVCHSGSQAGGHYVACVRRPVSNEWHMHDDEASAVLPEDTKCLAGVARSGYIFCYERHSR